MNRSWVVWSRGWVDWGWVIRSRGRVDWGWVIRSRGRVDRGRVIRSWMVFDGFVRADFTFVFHISMVLVVFIDVIIDNLFAAIG